MEEREKIEGKLTDHLYKAAQEWLEAKGGKAVLATGVSVQQKPDTGKVWDEFIIGVHICGRMPEEEANEVS